MPPKGKAPVRSGIMLAYPAEDKRIQAFPLVDQEDGSKKRVFFHQPKLNGERGRTEWFADEPYLFSSYGNDFRFIDHIRNEIAVLSHALKDKPKFDGEVYVHGWPRERIDSALRRKKNRNAEVESLQYHIFDYQGTGDLQFQRLRALGTVEQRIRELDLKSIRIVPYGVCSATNWLVHAECYIEEGYEGIILRNPFGVYCDKRSANLIKFKPTERDEYLILGLNQEYSIDGIPKNSVGSFAVTGDDQVQFDVGAGGLGQKEKERLWSIREEIVGKKLLVKHELLKTSGQVPIACVAVEVI